MDCYNSVWRVQDGSNCLSEHKLPSSKHCRSQSSFTMWNFLLLFLLSCFNSCTLLKSLEKKLNMYVHDIMHSKLVQKRDIISYNGCCIFNRWKVNLIEIFPIMHFVLLKDIPNLRSYFSEWWGKGTL